MAAEIIHDDDVAGFEEWNELLFDIGAEAFAVDWAVEDARRRELVAAQGAEESQRPPVAAWHEARTRSPLGPHPRSGAMLVLIQVSSMNTRRRGSRSACHERQRRRLRAMSARACSRANSVFFKPQPLASQE